MYVCLCVRAGKSVSRMLGTCGFYLRASPVRLPAFWGKIRASLKFVFRRMIFRCFGALHGEKYHSLKHPRRYLTNRRYKISVLGCRLEFGQNTPQLSELSNRPIWKLWISLIFLALERFNLPQTMISHPDIITSTTTLRTRHPNNTRYTQQQHTLQKSKPC